MKIWIDIKNAHEPLFFKSFLNYFKDYEFYITSRDFAEIIDLMERYGIKYDLVGKRPEGNILKRVLGFYFRVFQLYMRIKDVDVSLSHMSVWAVKANRMRRKKSIVFTDNDINTTLNMRIFKYIDFLITPLVIPHKKLVQQKANPRSIFQYDGYKEDIYIADFVPDKNFIKDLPFSDFVTVRPESLQALYVPKDAKTIVPQLLKLLEKENINVLFLPRYKSDRDYARGFSNVYIPPEPLNGLDVCYYSKAVLTGAGTFAREAACMGTPAVSFFPGERLLAVDQQMVEDGWIYHSRDPKEIVEYVVSSKKREVDLSRSKRVQTEVFNILNGILEEIEEKKGS